MRDSDAADFAMPIDNRQLELRQATAAVMGHPASVPVRFRLTDLGNGERMAKRHGADLRYCHPWGRWFHWDGRRWQSDSTAEVERRAKETIRSIYGEASRLMDDRERKALVDHARASERDPRLRAMIARTAAETGIPILPEQLDVDRWLLNVQNGTLNLKTGQLQPHRREDLATKLAPVEYDARAGCENWIGFLYHILNQNEKLMTFLQRSVGYALTGDTREQVLFLLHGTGANGKSTLLEVVLAMLGDYACQTPTDTLLVKHGDTIPNDVARLKGARLVAAIETEQGRRLAESLVKQLTGRDRVAARFMRAEWFEFQPQFKLFLAVNHKPVIHGTDLAIWRRIRLVPFTVVIPEPEQDKELPDKLKGELPGILRWAVEGCLAWQREGLGTPDEVRKATESYRAEMDTMGDFLSECCVIEPGFKVTVKELYRVYAQWCERNGEHPLSQRSFGMRLTERGLDRVRGAGGQHIWRGVGIDGVTQVTQCTLIPGLFPRAPS